MKELKYYIKIIIIHIMNNNLYVKAYNQISEDNYDIYINCTSDKPFIVDKINFRLSVEDNGDLRQYKILYDLLIKDNFYIYKSIDTFLEQNKKICIFCNQGRQRSCAVYVCYLIYKGYSIKDAINILQENKKDAFFGNVNFMDTINMFAKLFLYP